MNDRPRRVIKVGGSLLTLDNLASAFHGWLAAQPAALNVVLVGGGDLADAIRAADARFQLGDEECHALCLRVMSVSARLFAAVLQRHAADSGFRIVDNLSDIRAALEQTANRELLICDPLHFFNLEESAPNCERLPRSWDVTSDSIALWLATLLAIDELVLLKSNSPPKHLSAREAAIGGFVDPFFQKLAGGVRRIRYVNLRSENWDECKLFL